MKGLKMKGISQDCQCKVNKSYLLNFSINWWDFKKNNDDL